MKILNIITLLLFLPIYLFTQIPSNVTSPYSFKNNVELDLSNIRTEVIEKPNFAIHKVKGKDIYAFDINTNVNIIEKGTIKNLGNEKKLNFIRIKSDDAKSLNLTFEDFYLSQNSKMFIYTLDMKQVMGPITNANNNKVFNTHILLTDEVIIEVVSDINSIDNVVMTNVAYGIKDAAYFSDINKETFFEYQKKYQTQSVTCLQSMLDTKHYCNYLTRSSGVNMEQVNCPNFNNLDKAKRAICVIISHNSDSNHWEAKGGILINTATNNPPNQANNYCNSYVLTCAHCVSGYFTYSYPYVDPTDIVVRFNWLRKECIIPSSMPDCNINKTAWEDLIDYSEVIDYCDVDLLERDNTINFPNQTHRAEYAFLKINEPLRFKEYYNGWKIYNSSTYEIRDFTIMGAWGGNPFEAKHVEASIGGQSGTINYSYFLLADGHSGTSIFENNTLVGICNTKPMGTTIGTLYINDIMTWPNTNPRDILDPDDIYATDFDNGDSIVIEGVERYEKSNCLFSTTQCNPTLDLSDYITPIPGNGCCFRFEYIDELDGFVGGSPYGIRIYRDNEAQNTLYYDFGSSVFGTSETAYYNESNGMLIEFCIDSEELESDNGKIVVEFQDNNGRIICVKEVEVECLDCCSDDNINIYLEPAGDPGNCCAYIYFDIDTANTIECGYFLANIYDNNDSTYINGFIINSTPDDTIFTVPFAYCNYDTIAKQLLVEIYNEDSTLICSKVTPQYLPPCLVSGLVGSGSNEKEEFDIATKSIKEEEIEFEYYIKEDEKIEIEMFNKYNVSLGIIQNKESKKGTNEFNLNIKNLKPDIYIFKMKGEKEEIIRRLIIE